MRGNLGKFVLIFALCALASTVSKAGTSQNFVDACLGSTKALDSTLTCGYVAGDNKSTTVFTLKKGIFLHVKTTGLYGNSSRIYKVFKIKQLEIRRDSDLGFMGESAEFFAHQVGGSMTATITIPCNQAQYAAIGADKVSGDQEPSQRMSACEMK